RGFAAPLWDGAPLEGGTLLLHTEQGLGDALQFVRYAPLAKARGATVVLECEEALVRLLAACPGVDRVVRKGDPLPDFDAHAPLLSLPAVFGTLPETVPAAVPYLEAGSGARPLPPRRPGARLRVGIAWAGSRGHVKNRHRSCDLALFDGLIARDDLEVFSLQKGAGSEALAAHPLRDRVHDLGAAFRDLADTAGAVAQLDLVISVDTAVAHLAGALGVPCWTLLPFDADWRWMTGRADTPWYPSMRLFRQDAVGEWASVLARVEAEVGRALPVAPGGRARFAEGVRLHVAGDAAGAEAAYREALALDGGIAEAHNNLGVLLRGRGEAEAGLAAFRRAAELRPAYADALNNLGLALRDGGDLPGAVAAFRAAAEAGPEHADPWNNLGVALRETGEAAASLEPLRTAVQLRPDHPEFANNLGNTLLELGMTEEAVACYGRALELRPDYPEALNNLGAAHRARRDFRAAVPLLKRALELRPGYADALHNLALAFPQAEDAAEAEALLRDALARDPASAQVRAILAVALQEAARFPEAAELALEVVESGAEIADAWVVLGICAMEEGRAGAALRAYDRALEIDPRSPTARWNRALALLATGDYRRGWAEYEQRWRLMYFAPDRRVFAEPAWDGSSLDGRTVLLYTEQGLGDGIQFVRFARVLRERWDARVVVEAAAPLVPLFRTCPWIDEVFERGAPRPPFDVHAALLSLPGLLGTELDTLPAGPYFAPLHRPVADRVRGEGALKVGLVWGGRTPNANLARRSVPLALMERLAEVPGVRLYSLQKGDAEGELAGSPLAGRVVDLAPEIGDFVDTAAAIARLDLVVTIDTSVAHLAAAMGKRTWVLLIHAADWRWLLDREDSPWYPSARLFRQRAPGDWAEVVERVAAELRALSGAEPAPATTRLPSAQRRPDGTPRFTLEVPFAALADDAGFARYGAELAGGGVDADLRELLDAQLRDGDSWVDVGAGWGFAALGAATAPGRSVRALALVDDPADLAVLRSGVAGAVLTGSLEAARVERLADVPVDVLLDGAPAERRGDVFLRVAVPGALPAVLAGAAGVVASGRLAMVAWTRHPASAGEGAALADTVVREGLSAFGYAHFALARDGEGAMLLPLEAAPDAERVVSLSAGYLARETEAPSPAAVPASAPERTPLGIDWELGATSGWGVYGTNLALHALRRGDLLPVPLSAPDLRAMNPLQRRLLEPALEAHRSAAEQLERAGGGARAHFTLLRALGNGLRGSVPDGRLAGRREVGVVFFEDTALDRAAVERGRRYARVVAGSTWNAEVLRAAGVEEVVVALQGIDPTVFHPAPRSGVLGDRFVVFSGGKLEYRKGQDLVVAAFREIRRRHPEALLVTAWHNHWPRSMAEVPLRGHVRGTPAVDASGRLDVTGWLAANGVPADAVLDLGLAPNAQMGALLREADVALFPNRCEGGTNLVAMECMASGVPVVLSANTGHLDLVDDRRCFALRDQRPALPTAQFAGTEGWGESSVEEMVDALEAVYADRAEAARRAAEAALFMRDFAWSARIDHLLALLGDLL
ncbi:MAG TPA: tetratricopeptide repeat protein, partial [Longimicrobiaceae bacterium]